MPEKETATYTIGDYLLDRIAELGITEMFGVPGDYNLRFLDHVVAHDKIRWVGNANELNAGYAADGYARLKGAAALLTTYGVGELSAVNAIAGSYAESLPVIHVVGAPSKKIQAERLTVHHSLGTGDFQPFMRMASEISAAVADLEIPTAPWEIDRVIRQALFERKPGYILMAADVAAAPCSPPSAPLELVSVQHVKQVEESFEEAARKFLRGKKTSMLADLMVHRLGAREALNRMLERTNIPVATLTWGKSLVDESSENFAGMYTGASSKESTRKVIEEAEALISLGVTFNDTISSGFSMNIDPSAMIEVQRDVTTVGDTAFTPISMASVIEILERIMVEESVPTMPIPDRNGEDVELPVTDEPLDQDLLWQEVAKFIDGNNIVIAEQGCSFFGLSQQRLPKGAFFVGQPQWGSIGYTLPAAMGAGLADRSKRPFLLIGDGSAQLTIQELGQMIREKVPAVIVLINNDGYTVERVIHGPEEIYNDIPAWRWDKALEFFGGTQENTLTLKATTGNELLHALTLGAENPDKLVLIEACTPRMDAPAALRAATENL